MGEKHDEGTPEGHDKINAIEDALVKEIPRDMSRWVHMVACELPCCICEKSATEAHLRSSVYLKRITEDAIGMLSVGQAKTTLGGQSAA